MKKLIPLFLAMIVLGVLIQACDDSETYAEQQDKERKAIRQYISDNNIKVISQAEFEKDTITNVDENEYVLFSNGVYMQIVDRGTGDSIKNRDEVLVRFMEYDILNGDTTYASNYNVSEYVDAFYYTHSGSTVSGQFVESYLTDAYYSIYGVRMETAVPTGWLVPMLYIKDRARVKLIVPHKVGHKYASQYVLPFFYDIYRYQIR